MGLYIRLSDLCSFTSSQGGQPDFYIALVNLSLKDDMNLRKQRKAESACIPPGALWWHSFGHEREDNVCSLTEDKISVRTNSELGNKIPLKIRLI